MSKREKKTKKKTGSDVEASAGETTTHRFEAEVEQVLRLVIESLYTSREVFLRELVSNASDALDKLRFRSVTEPGLMAEGETLEVRLLPDAEAGTLTIWDSGVGMSREELVDNLGTIAKSGSRELLARLEEAKKGELSLIGQFGVGFYSGFLVADKIEVVSRAAGAEEAFRWISEGKGSFTVEPAERDVHGTSVTLHLGEEHRAFAEPAELRRLIERYSDYLSWPIQLRTPGKEGEEASFTVLNRGTALWQRPRSEIDAEAAGDLYRHLTRDWEAPLAYRAFKLEGVQEFAGMIFLPRRAPFDLFVPDAKHGMRLYVKRVFILDDAEQLVPRWLRFLRGLVDSEDLPLNVSRELLQDSKVVRVIQKQVKKQAVEMLGELAAENEEDYAVFWKTFGAVLKEGLHLEPDSAKDLTPLLRFESSAGEGLTSFAAYKERMKEGQDAIYFVTAESRRQAEGSPHIEALRARGFEVLYLTDAVDQFAFGNLNDVDGTPLKDAADAGLEFEPEAESEATAARDAELGDLKERFRVALQDLVSEVRLSRRMAESPVCLVRAEGGMPPHLERLLRAAQPDMPVQKRILEINPAHPVIESLRKLHEAGDPEGELGDWIGLLYDQALIAEGSPIEDPASFNRRVSQLWVRASRTFEPGASPSTE